MFDPNQPDLAAVDTANAAGTATAATAAVTAAAPVLTYTDLDASNGSWGSRDLPLKFPFKLKGANYDKLTFREPNGFDIDLAAQAGGTAMIRTLMVNLSAMPIEVLDAMHGQDRAGAMKIMGEFFDGSPAT